MTLILTNRTALLVAAISILSYSVCSAADRTNGADRIGSSIPIAFIDVNLVSMNREEVVDIRPCSSRTIESSRSVRLPPFVYHPAPGESRGPAAT
jgi:hypothetical protein